MNPKAYKIGIKLVSNIIKVSGIKIDYVNVGVDFHRNINMCIIIIKRIF